MRKSRRGAFQSASCGPSARRCDTGGMLKDWGIAEKAVVGVVSSLCRAEDA